MKTLAAFFTLLIFSGQAQALGRLADVRIVDRTTGATLPLYRHAERYYLAGESGHEFRIDLTNRSEGRLMAVSSVDGVNVLNGETADVDQNGYVLSPWQAMSIAGWRKSLNDIAAFYFTRLPNSYAARTGRPDNVGVIGVAFFREKRQCCQPAENEPRARDDTAPERSEERSYARPAARPESSSADRSAQTSEKLGTGHGRTERSEVRYTDFERASAAADEVVTIYYDSYRNLRRLGIIPSPWRLPVQPQAFPGGFVPDP